MRLETVFAAPLQAKFSSDHLGKPLAGRGKSSARFFS